MANQANQPNKPDQSNKPQQSDPSRTPGQEKGRTPNEGGANRGSMDEQRKGGTAPDRSNPSQQQGDRSRKDSGGGNSPDVTIPNPKNPGYGDNEPGDPRRMEVDADDASTDMNKKNPRRT